MPALVLVALAAFIINIPFGFWRAGARKFSFRWYVAVHAAVPIIALLRIQAGISWQLTTFPVMIGAYCCGQFAGSRLRAWWIARGAVRRRRASPD